jgi:hypothetical protein
MGRMVQALQDFVSANGMMEDLCLYDRIWTTSAAFGPLVWWFGGSYVFTPSQVFSGRARFCSVQDPAVNQGLEAGGFILPAAATPTGIDKGISL